MPLCGSHYISDIPDLVCHKNLYCDEREIIMRKMAKDQKAEHTRIASSYESTFTKAKSILEEFLQGQPEEAKLGREAAISVRKQEEPRVVAK